MNFFKVFFGGIKDFFVSLKNLKHIKRFIPAFIVSIVWIVVPILYHNGVENRVLDIVSKVFLARIGISDDPLSIAGGVIAKCTFVTALYSFFNIFKKNRGEKISLKERIKKHFAVGKGMLALYLWGIGLCILWLCAINRNVSTWSVACAISMIILSGKTLIRGSFFLRLLKSIFKGEKTRKVPESFMQGCLIGAVLVTAACFTDNAIVNVGVVIGALLLLALGLIVLIIKAFGKKKTVAAAMVLMLLLPAITAEAKSKAPKIYEKYADKKGYYVTSETSDTVSYAGYAHRDGASDNNYHSYWVNYTAHEDSGMSVGSQSFYVDFVAPAQYFELINENFVSSSKQVDKAADGTLYEGTTYDNPVENSLGKAKGFYNYSSRVENDEKVKISWEADYSLHSYVKKAGKAAETSAMIDELAAEQLSSYKATFQYYGDEAVNGISSNKIDGGVLITAHATDVKSNSEQYDSSTEYMYCCKIYTDEALPEMVMVTEYTGRVWCERWGAFSTTSNPDYISNSNQVESVRKAVCGTLADACMASSFEMVSTDGTDYNSGTSVNSGKNALTSKQDNSGKTFINISTKASDDFGEQEVELPTIIFITLGTTLLGVGAAAGAMGATGSTTADAASNSVNEADDEKKRYSMIINTDCGSVIRKGGEPVKVGAKLVCHENGAQNVLADITAAMTITVSDELEITGSFIEDGCKYVTVKTVGEPSSDNASITFTAETPGGGVSNKVEFKLNGDMQIVFPEQHSYNTEMYTSVIAGANDETAVRFVIEQAAGEPESIEFTVDGDFEIVKKDTEYERTYDAVIKNNTVAHEDRRLDIYEKSVRIEAKYKDGSTVEGFFSIEVYPEGLTLTTRPDRENHIDVYSYSFRKADVENFDPEYKSARLDFVLAVLKDGKAEFVKLSQASLKSGKLTPENDSHKALCEKYEFDVDTKNLDDNFLHITPKASIPESKTPYYVNLEFEASVDGKAYVETVPLRLIGDALLTKASFDKELRDLCDRALRYFPEDLGLKYVQYIKENYSDSSIYTADNLRTMSHELIRASQEYWLREGARQKEVAAQCDWIIDKLQWSKKVGDFCFSIVISTAASPMVEAVLTPVKDVFCAAAGEIIYSYINGEPLDYNSMEFGKNCFALLENVVSECIDMDVTKPLDTKKAMALIIGLSFIMLCKNYYLTEEKERDIVNAIRDTFKDLTATAIKKIFDGVFGCIMNDTKCKGSIENKVREWVGSKLDKVVPDPNGGYETALTKLLSDWFGELGGNVYEGYETVSDACYTTIDLPMPNNVHYTMVINLNTVFNGGVACRFAEWLIASLFGALFPLEFLTNYTEDPVAALAEYEETHK